MGKPRGDKTWREEPILAGMAFFVVLFLTLFVGVTIFTGAAGIDPRAAALDALAPSALVAAAAAGYTPSRRFFARLIFWSGG
ncbi:MAG: hypothetical protein NT015_14820 [Alphaproteobacteria bacterium]|nr:hypothetical protein [Alphaproteobacteria bacterium]